MYKIRIYKEIPGEKQQFDMSEAVGQDPVTLHQWAERYIERTYPNEQWTKGRFTRG